VAVPRDSGTYEPDHNDSDVFKLVSRAERYQLEKD
jgi:hypothetical protein